MPWWTPPAVCGVALLVIVAIVVWWPLRPRRPERPARPRSPRIYREEADPFDSLPPEEQDEVRRWTKN